MHTRILFVCLGNICRSPLAEGIGRKIAWKNALEIDVDSAGTGNWHVGESPCPHSVTVAAQNGVDISKLRARQVRIEDFSSFDHIIALDSSNYTDLKHMGCTKVRKLGEFGLSGEDIPDPYFFKGFEGFERVYRMIETGVCGLYEELGLFSPRK